MNLELEGKSVLITGGSKGIGLACARSFSAEGCRVHLAARTRGSFGHMIEPEQVGDTVAFLASARAGRLSGVVLNLGA
jgi:short-subunit dehydrogenase involved in D-alanine esterification of teichoic acids